MPMHMPTSASPSGGDGDLGGRVVRYTATGSEGVDFFVPIGTTLGADDYEISFSPQSMAAVPAYDFPNEVAGDRTTTQFRMRISAPLTAGDKLVFLLFQ